MNLIFEGFNSCGDTEMFEQELYNEMFGWEAYRKDAGMYNDALKMYSRITERHHLNQDLTTQL